MAVSNIKLDGGGIGGAMLCNKCVQSVLSAANSNDLGSLGNELVGQASTNARGRANNEDRLVSERHLRYFVYGVVTIGIVHSLETVGSNANNEFI